ncbi:MAG: acyl-CoA thioesterase [Candidatus Margulisbacteria bacterium]|nr:acyl-CoA thioesterase [Candidatus Margulisiibacteriota bacterium]
MMIWLRLICVFIKSIFLKPYKRVEDISKESISLKFRVGFFEADVGHLNNARYMTFMESCRLHIMIRTGHFFYARRHKWFPVIGAQCIRYVRPIKRFQIFEVKSRLIYWDRTSLYFEHIFESNREIVAYGYIKVIWVKDGKVIPSREAFECVGFEYKEMPEPEVIKAWKQYERSQHKHIKSISK